MKHVIKFFYSIVPSALLTIKYFLFIRNRFYRLMSLIVVSFLFSFICNAAKYYVSSTDGNDANSGTSTATPWKSLAKVNSFSLQPGDEILFRRGDQWIGTITVNSSGNAGSHIVYGAYGEGDKPKIYGSEVITGWQLHAGNIYKATFNTTTTQIFVNGVKMKLARLTNTGYNTVNAVTSQTQFSCDALNAGLNYTGARVMLRTENWYSIMRSVTSSNSKTLTISSAPAGTIKVNQGFLLMNKLEFLDSAGEWYYDTATKTVYLWAPNGDTPANYEIRGSVIDNGVYISNQHYITIQDLNIIQHKEKGLSVNGNSLTIDNNQIEGQGYGIFAEGEKSGCVFQNNKVNDVHGIGIYAWISNSIIRDNEVTNIGVFETLGLTGTVADNGGGGLEISGTGNIIEYNRIIGTNYNGIMWRGNTIIRYNFIKDVLRVKSDGGGIYTGGTTGSGSLVAYNIIDNAVGNQAGGTTGRNLGEGIYLDEPTLNITAEYNTVTRCSDVGIFLHRTGSCIIRHNTVFDARAGFMASKYSGTVKSSVTNNLFVIGKATDDYDPRQLALSYSGGNVTFDNNIYVNGFTSDLVFKIVTPFGYNTFNQWKAFIGSDANSTYIGTKLAVGEKQEIFYNATKIAKTFHLNGAVAKDVYGVTVSGTFTLQPFTSIILRGTNLLNISEISTGIKKPEAVGSLCFYPNPFNGEINIEFAGKNSNVTIDVFDNLGSLINRVYNGYAVNELSTFVWNGRGGNGTELPDGIYYIRIMSEGNIQTGKVFKIR
jgi:parallel beta-helix repeat protein